jgi:hypothetical protein
VPPLMSNVRPHTVTPSDFRLLLEQSLLAAKAEAIVAGQKQASSEQVASALREALVRVDLWQGDSDASLVNRYSRGEITLVEFEEHFVGRR